jgi:hypothetical protein
MVQSIDTILSKEKADGGHAYINTHGTKNKTTTAMWDPQVERAVFHSLRSVRSQREQYDTIRNQQQGEVYDANRCTISNYQKSQYVSVCAGNLQ